MARIDEQVRATRPDRSVLLSASAGSGKTRVLVMRMIHLLAAGIPPERVAAITFTEKAAGEMKDRLYKALSDAAWEKKDIKELLELGPADAPYPLTKTPEDIFSSLTVRPDALQVSTIHAFCLRLLRQFPLEAGLPPDFSVMDEAEIPIRRELAAEKCLEPVRDSALEVELLTLIDTGLTLRDVKDLLVLSLDKRGQISRLTMDAGGFDGFMKKLDNSLDPATIVKNADGILSEGGLQRIAVELAGFLKGHGLGDEEYIAALEGVAGLSGLDGLPKVFEELKGFVYTKELSYKANTPISKSASESAAGAESPSLKGKVLKEKTSELKGRHDTLFHALRDGLNALAGLHDGLTAARALTAFLKLYKETEEQYTERNRRDGLVDYDDLEIHAYRLMTGPDAEGVLSRIEARVLHYLVDEFQDTGAVQWGILERLNSETFAGMGAEGLASPTLFAVGDVKQSIYRFRKADYRLMGSLRRKMETHIEPGRADFPELVHNFRSAPEIVRVVDETFGSLLEGYKTSVVFRDKAGGSAALRVVPEAAEAETLADEVVSALGLPVWDEKVEAFRPAGYGDMAVLLRSRTGLKAYEEALKRRGVRYKVTGGVGFFFQEEVQAILGVLGYIENPSDLLSLATALKSPLFGLSDGEIETVYKDPETLRDACPEAFRLISAWRRDAGAITPGRLVEEVVRSSAALFAFGISSGPAAALNIEKLTGIARDFDRRGGAGLSGFMDWVKAYREKAELATADVELPGFTGFVNIMTVHAAKGLEFPVVFLPGAARKPKTAVDGFIIGEGDDGSRIALKTRALLKDNPQYARLKEDEERERAEEATRLMYVAMTRARDHLVMLAGVKEGKNGWDAPKQSWLLFLLEARPKSLFGQRAEDISHSRESGNPEGLKREDTTVLPYYYVGADLRVGPLLSKTEEGPFEGLGEIDPSSLSGRLAPLPPAQGISFVSPHELAGDLPEDDEPGKPYPAKLRGALIHKALESFGRRGKYDIPASADRTPGFAALDRNSAKALIADAERTVSDLLEDGGIRALLSPCKDKYFELPVLLKREGTVLAGSADLVLIDGARARVVDYKTGLTNAPLEKIKEAYLPQLLAYCDAVKEAFGLLEAVPYLLLVDRRKMVPLLY